jgi:4-hydroxybenzoate polyprenyl transferase
MPYLRLMRLQAPIGTWLYLFPGWWSLCLGVVGAPDWWDLVLFGGAAVLMRGSICTVNDIVDRHIDAQVVRTASRPIPSGAVSVPRATAFAVVQTVAALTLLWSVRGSAAAAVALSYPLFVIYPYMKRLTYLPQAWLAMCFNTYALAGALASTGRIGAPALMLWASGFFWTLGYDTIYAHQDKEDDRRIGVKSTALLFGGTTRIWLIFFYVATLAGLVAAGALAGTHWPYYLLLVPAAGHLWWQLVTLDIDYPERCRRMFVANRVFGWIVLAAVLVGQSG